MIAGSGSTMESDTEHHIGYGFIPLYKRSIINNNKFLIDNQFFNESDLLLNWESKGILFKSDYLLYAKYNWLSNTWECPQIYSINNESTIFQFSNDFNSVTVRDYKQLPKSNNERSVMYTIIAQNLDTILNNVEKYNETILLNDSIQLYEFDGSAMYYAADYTKLKLNNNNELINIVFGWIDEDKSNITKYYSKWNGIQSIPRQVYLCNDNPLTNYYILCKKPIENINNLRYRRSGDSDSRFGRSDDDSDQPFYESNITINDSNIHSEIDAQINHELISNMM